MIHGVRNFKSAWKVKSKKLWGWNYFRQKPRTDGQQDTDSVVVVVDTYIVRAGGDAIEYQSSVNHYRSRRH